MRVHVRARVRPGVVNREPRVKVRTYARELCYITTQLPQPKRVTRPAVVDGELRRARALVFRDGFEVERSGEEGTHRGLCTF